MNIYFILLIIVYYSNAYYLNLQPHRIIKRTNDHLYDDKLLDEVLYGRVFK